MPALQAGEADIGPHADDAEAIAPARMRASQTDFHAGLKAGDGHSAGASDGRSRVQMDRKNRQRAFYQSRVREIATRHQFKLKLS